MLGYAKRLLAGKELKPESIAEIRKRHSATNNLGWQHHHASWSGGDLCSTETIGHTGFTGTGLWIDFARGYAWTLLTNRVHPTRHVETGIQDLRKAVGNRLAAAPPF